MPGVDAKSAIFSNGGIAVKAIAHSMLIVALWVVGSCFDGTSQLMIPYVGLVLTWFCWPIRALTARSWTNTIGVIVAALIVAAPVIELFSFVTCPDCRHSYFICSNK
jgi:hypothetical protein